MLDPGLRQRSTSGAPGHVLHDFVRVIVTEASTVPVIDTRWRLRRLTPAGAARHTWLAWDPNQLSVTITAPGVGPPVCLALRRAGYRLVAVCAAGHIWAHARMIR
ncbi:MAG: hypothetical protein ACYDH6_24670 [Acidimicrobiales bacterium]